MSLGFAQQGSAQLAALHMLCQHTRVGVSLHVLSKHRLKHFSGLSEPELKTLKKTKHRLFS